MSEQYLCRNSLAIAALILAGAVGMPCLAQDVQQTVPTVGTAPNTNSEASGSFRTPKQKRLGRRVATSPAVQEVLRMLDAGVSKEVVKTYVQSAPLTSQPTASDMIALKEHAVPDEITVALLKRSAELAQQGQKSSQSQVGVVSAPPDAGRTGNRFYLDPESYEYFQYYYLYPRTLANAYDRLGYYFWSDPGYYGPVPPYSYYRSPAFRRGFYP